MRILVALGEPGAAESLARLLVEIGWPEPSIVTTSTEALSWIDANSGCDILIADTLLSPLDGFTLRDDIRTRLPALRTIMTCPQGVSMPLEHLGNDPFLPSPFTPTALADCLHQLLTEEPIATSSPVENPVESTPPPMRISLGSTLGNYRIESLAGEHPKEILYRANQTNVGRNVVLHILKPEFSSDTASVTAFQHRASLKAALDHPKVASVYEGGEIDGIHFFSTEDIPLPSLASRIRSGKKLPGLGAMEIVALVADVHLHLAASGAGSDPVDAEEIFYQRGKPPRLANIAAPLVEPANPPSVEIARLASMLLACLDPSPAAEPARKTLERAAIATTDSLDWNQLAELARAAFARTPPTHATATPLPAPKSNHTPRRILLAIAASALILPLAGYLLFTSLNAPPRAAIDDLGTMVVIPAGTFTYQGKPLDLPEFLISKYEVTIAEYAEFLDFLEKNPDQATTFDHPEQPPGKSHIPQHWADMTDVSPPHPGYFNRVKRWGQYQGAPLTLDSPVFGVDWFDAYAYAKWKGQRLPTEQEWEKAALGPNESPFPWGKEADPKRANTGKDFSSTPDPKSGGGIDGFKRWSPVDKPSTDASAAGVLGTSGNVSEWTASQLDGPNGTKTAVIRGGNWKTKPFPATFRITRLPPTHADEALGFRTAMDPPKNP